MQGSNPSAQIVCDKESNLLIRKIEEKDIITVVSLIHELNNLPSFYNAYMPKTLPSIEREINDAVANGSALVYEEEGAVKGILVFFKAPSEVIDMSGPFVVDEDERIGNALLETLIKTYEGTKINAFFSKTSSFYISLMEKKGFTLDEYEYILSLEKKRFSGTRSVSLRRAREEEKETLTTLKNHIFGDIYITDTMFKGASYYSNTFVLEEEDVIIGLAVMKKENSTTNLEIFGIDSAYRGKGYGKRFLETLLFEAFEDNEVKSIKLVVDVVNETALNLYKKIGFEIVDRNVSYRLNER